MLHKYYVLTDRKNKLFPKEQISLECTDWINTAFRIHSRFQLRQRCSQVGSLGSSYQLKYLPIVDKVQQYVTTNTLTPRWSECIVEYHPYYKILVSSTQIAYAVACILPHKTCVLQLPSLLLVTSPFSCGNTHPRSILQVPMSGCERDVLAAGVAAALITILVQRDPDRFLPV